MKEGDYNGEQNGSRSETEAVKGLAEALFTGEAFRIAAVMRAVVIWIVHCGVV